MAEIDRQATSIAAGLRDHVLTPEADWFGDRVPEHTANFAWGDDGYRSLYITASTSVYRIWVQVPGFGP